MLDVGLLTDLFEARIRHRDQIGGDAVVKHLDVGARPGGAWVLLDDILL